MKTPPLVEFCWQYGWMLMYGVLLLMAMVRLPLAAATIPDRAS
jgi:hypothetical protein